LRLATRALELDKMLCCRRLLALEADREDTTWARLLEFIKLEDDKDATDCAEDCEKKG